jgi:uncharacterized membrane protein YuzA (DUF378 family)
MINKLYILSLSILLFGGLNWFLIGSINVDILNKFFSIITKKNSQTLSRISYLIIGICTLYLLIFHQRQMFLSFLNETVMPSSVFENETPVFTNMKITVDAPNAKKVIYWAANPVTKDHDNIDSWNQAYMGFTNAGVAEVINNKAELSFSNPVRYKVKNLFGKKLLDRHIHYRILYESGEISRIYTKKLSNSSTPMI